MYLNADSQNSFYSCVFMHGIAGWKECHVNRYGMYTRSVMKVEVGIMEQSSMYRV